MKTDLLEVVHVPEDFISVMSLTQYGGHGAEEWAINRVPSVHTCVTGNKLSALIPTIYMYMNLNAFLGAFCPPPPPPETSFDFLKTVYQVPYTPQIDLSPPPTPSLEKKIMNT